MKRERVALRSLGEKIKYLREREGYTQKEFAEKIDVSLDTVKNWEQGYNYPSIDMLCTIANFFKCDFDFLIGVQKEPNKLFKHIENYTGLSEKAVETLISAHLNGIPYIKTLSRFIENPTLLEKITKTISADYGKVSRFIDINDPWSPSKKRPVMIDPESLLQADLMNVYSCLRDFINEEREKLDF